MLKNSNTLAYVQLMKIDCAFRLLLTGTPLQNNLLELVSLLAFMQPELFQQYRVSLELIFKHKATTNNDSHRALLSSQRIEKARTMLAPFVLRRKKHQVLKDLPAKTRRVVYCEMTCSQKALYNVEFDLYKDCVAERLAFKNGEIKEKNSSQYPRTNILMALRKAAIHPLLFREHYSDEEVREMARVSRPFQQWNKTSKEEYIFEAMACWSDSQVHSYCSKYPDELGQHITLTGEHWVNSGKVQKLGELLHRFKSNGDRALVFSQFVIVLDILEWYFEDIGIVFSRIDGSTPVEERQELIDQYERDPSITAFMLTTGAGGAGINLTAANKVIIFDSSFNPQEDVQAENRAHRLGQKREVEVIRLITKETVEEDIHALGAAKLMLDGRVAGEEGLIGLDGDPSSDPADAKLKGMVSKMIEQNIENAAVKALTQQAGSGDTALTKNRHSL